MIQQIGMICPYMGSTVSKRLSKLLLHFGLRTSRKHWEKVDTAFTLHNQKGLPDVSELLRDLNDARKAAAYGDTEIPDLEAESIASQIGNYVDAVAVLLSEDNGDE